MKTMQGFGEAVDRIGGEPITARMARRAPIRHLDPSLLLTTLILASFGALMIWSASASKLDDAGLDPSNFLKRQVFFAIAGSALLLVVASIDYRHLRGFSPIILGATVIALIVVMTPLGTVANGARRWIDLGFFQVQPSEVAKLVGGVSLAA